MQTLYTLHRALLCVDYINMAWRIIIPLFNSDDICDDSDMYGHIFVDVSCHY